MNVNVRVLVVLLAVLLRTPSAEAHFLWIVCDAAASQAKVYFGEEAEPADPDLLAAFADLKLLRIEGGDKVTEVAVEKHDEALLAPLGAARGATLSHRYGVLERGGERFLLHYYATSQASALPGEWQPLRSSESAEERSPTADGVPKRVALPLEIVPRQEQHALTLTVYWRGKPLAAANIVVRGAGVEVEGTTDAEGRFLVQPRKAGLLAVRAKHVEQESGKLEDKAYDSVRHWTTLTVPVSVASMQSIDTALPALPWGVTSFGGAVEGDWVYLYGGHLGGSHHYWKEGQSDAFLRLNVREPQKWEALPSGPRRTGTAMAAHRGAIYRIGGFEARNGEAEEADLHSQDDAERFAVARGKWEPLPNLPGPRSSHDVAVLNNTLYVVGGWNLQKRGDGQFLETMLALDLTAEQPQWQEHPVPFQRRALSVAAHAGKLYVLGGMQENGGPTTRVDIYDPQTRVWSQGPDLQGAPMEGFGNASFEIGGKLTAITMSGAIQQLADDSKSWVVAGQLKHPRFFARLLPIFDNRGVVIGGAEMGTGKVTANEVIAPRSDATIQ
jgi:N-acetylneuraminic acid mutarotase/uncharacterized GH25 family protein